MKVLFDTNVVIDILMERQPFFKNSYAVLDMVAEKKIFGIVSAGAITDIYYLIRKEFPNYLYAQNAISDLLKNLFAVDTKAQDIHSALELGFSDFEDAVVSAVAVRERANFIITRNTKDFAKSSVKAVSPSDFLENYSAFV